MASVKIICVCAGSVLGKEPGEEAVRALHLPTFEESRSPLASVGWEEEVREPVHNEKGKVKEDTTSHPFVISGALPVVCHN